MVKALLVLCLFTPKLFAEGALRFAVEYSKAQAYQGEIIQAAFVLYSTYDRVEVEVAKFPEFRGYWSENTALRQGPLLLLPDNRSPGMRKAVVGTYLLTPMIGHPATVTPMRILVRTYSSAGTDEIVMDSEPTPLNIARLPTPPPALKKFYRGGVGHFTLRAESSVVRFFPKEPTSVRFYLSGNGNFPELNTLPIEWPEGVKVITEKSSTVGSGMFQTKTFEWIVTIEGEAPLVLPPLNYVYFSPITGRFETATSESVRLDPMKRPPEEIVAMPIELGIQKEWSDARPIQLTSGFVFFQWLLGSLWWVLAASFVLRRFQTWRRQSPWVALRLRWKHLLKEPAADPVQWFGSAEQLVFDTVDTHFHRRLQTRREAVDRVGKKWGPESADTAKRVFSEWESLRFSPSPPPPPSPSEWKPRLVQLKKKLLRHRLGF